MAEFSKGQKIRTTTKVRDSESGYVFESGTVGEFYNSWTGPYCSVYFQCKDGDPLDSGEMEVMCKLTDIEPYEEA
ncbi:hypothetical protein [Microbulbifer epialgicus]|uniref:Uncharacterized protein n=1 Tax=Microbulbifer epialgicus TaxID=393907 RepID=A0ABV4NTT6_9GAMM